MTKQINDYTSDELSAKIEAIKAERERTANALKRYEEELERRKQEVPLGVPSKFKSYMYYFLNSKNEVVCPNAIDNERDGLERQSAYNIFESYESAEKHAEMLLDWRKALVANSKGEQIDIKALLPLLKKGWVAMDEDGDWYFFTNKPYVNLKAMDWRTNDIEFWKIRLFNLKPATDWKNSLMECGL